MIGATLAEIHAHIESLASETGEYGLVRARHGDRPVPAVGLRFEDRATARAAARATEQYRAALRQYDPRLPYHDVVVRQEVRPRSRRGSADPERRSGTEHADASMGRTDDHRDTEADRTEMRGGDPEQSALLARSASRFAPAGTTEDPVSAALELLESRRLLGGYAQLPEPEGTDPGAGAVEVRITAYALSARDERLPILPIALELCRHGSNRVPSSLRVADTGADWTVTLEPARHADPDGSPPRNDGLERTPFYSLAPNPES